MLKDYVTAGASLAHPGMAGELEALLWQAALAAEAEDWPAAATGFAAALDLIDPYPDNLRLSLGLAAAEAFLQTGDREAAAMQVARLLRGDLRSEEHTSELQSLMRTSYAVFCLKKKITIHKTDKRIINSQNYLPLLRTQ